MNNFNIYNNKTGAIEPLKVITEGKVSMYVCGPTVYNYAHIGNARPVVVFDTLRRTLEADGYEVEYISNVTDVDDKIINKAIEENVDERVIAQRYLDAYLDLCDRLHVLELAYRPKVTDTMDSIIEFIGKLIELGYAYSVDGDVYFRVNKINNYGEHSKQNVEELEIGSRIEENSLKENPLDFALWKKTDKGISWDSPFGKGRPGWHTECVVMINNYFKRKIDIHGGGMDLKFPHHENEIAQAQACYNHGLANYWMYNGMLNIDGQKMSKSIGNVLWAKDIVQQIKANNTRWMLLSAHYRAPLNINDELVDQVEVELNKIYTALKLAWVKLSLNNYKGEKCLESSFQEFIKWMNDDLNTPNAYKVIFEMVKALNNSLRQREVDLNNVSQILNSLVKALEVLGISFEEVVLSEEDKEVYSSWVSAKTEKDFDKADGYRNILSQRGII